MLERGGTAKSQKTSSLYELRVARLSACRADLMGDGIDVSRMDRRQLCDLVAQHLEYFQMMVGHDVSCREIIGALARVRATPSVAKTV
jgi:hypothetical protein